MKKDKFVSVSPQGDFSFDKLGITFEDSEIVIIDKQATKSIHLDNFKEEWVFNNRSNDSQGIMRRIASFDYIYLILNNDYLIEKQPNELKLLQDKLLAPGIVSIFFLDTESGYRYDYFVSWSGNNRNVNEDVKIHNKQDDITITIEPKI